MRVRQEVVIIDAKTGKPGPAHTIQVMTYMYADPKAIEQYLGTEFRGHVIYPDGNVQIPASGVDGKFIDRLGSLIRRLAADDVPARKVPSAVECRFCDITAEDCPERVEREADGHEGMTHDF